MSRPLVAIESPYAPRNGYSLNDNVEFAERCCSFAINNGFNPYAMHLFYPRFLIEDNPQERALGIECGLAWTEKADMHWFCLREGEIMSDGMVIAFDKARIQKRLMFSLVFPKPGNSEVEIKNSSGNIISIDEILNYNVVSNDNRLFGTHIREAIDSLRRTRF